MKKALLAAAAVLAISAGSEVYSQEVAVQITPEQRTVIREYVVKKRVKPARISGEIRVGAALPADVELVAVPAEWGPSFTRYRYVYSDNHVVLVDPGSRKIVYVVD